jgi:endonuclease/exonuclease/phosphatase family metal-dependent hydrolase
MVRWIGEDADIVCLQEVPVWALPRLAEWSGMQAFGAVARKPRALSAELGRLLTLHHGLLRSAFTGEAGAILVAPGVGVGKELSVVVGNDPLCRIAQAVRIDERIDVVNFHINADLRELERVAEIPSTDKAILAGDANVRSASVAGFSPPLEGSIDQILVRGLRIVEGPRKLDRVHEGVVLSDHAPLELRLA